MESVQVIKQRFGIIGNDPQLNRSIEKATRVAPTDISVLVIGESGVGKESIPKIIHSLSHRKHNNYIAVNCGAIPEGTIDSELFGHEKGAFTGANNSRKGYFEVADGGTIFLDEVGELPLTTQVRLLRVLENGEFIKVGSSDVQKTNVRIVAATNVKMIEAIKKGRFREDLYYRLSTIEIELPPLRNRNEDIHLLFRKFASDFAQKYKMPTVRLNEEAIDLLLRYHFPGNIRQLRNIAEQVSIIEENRNITATVLKNYLPNLSSSSLPMVVEESKSFSTEEKSGLLKMIYELRTELNELKKVTLNLMHGNKDRDSESFLNTSSQPKAIAPAPVTKPNSSLISYQSKPEIEEDLDDEYSFIETIEEDENLSLQDKEIEMIKKSLERNNNKRKLAAKELGISERTLYRKIKQYNL
ncbi:sigma-54-dependent Fis family transcriptional regulator [Wenyingzhuangia sp. 2_MG-2023]|uniref:sigma-54 interaction domain-containing protein n=1 Tax=Wenyingzhuangia sp. 2_MG-2023 TaxID=3062639 RepID=UPI0026E2948D|nr:sigma-54 dependent transcriptional regulator [Wenyingzhuangia sp. 2_MG-2023]MDO6737672.1 sigma-54 dependent transcriptional regulator [Wenyingzhuangia sp. 2_MG-2023]MDO6802511.1 sigma-54 dependent transcriptional regulator [Wenyingzhuangia sp. 1_MG-2023]